MEEGTGSAVSCRKFLQLSQIRRRPHAVHGSSDDHQVGQPHAEVHKTMREKLQACQGVVASWRLQGTPGCVQHMAMMDDYLLALVTSLTRAEPHSHEDVEILVQQLAILKKDGVASGNMAEAPVSDQVKESSQVPAKPAARMTDDDMEFSHMLDEFGHVCA